MRSSTRLVVNTSAQYARTIVNLILSLYSTRLILHALGVADYGIFTLIAGVVSMLAFMTNAMVTTTQRFMSYHQTKSSLEEQKRVFGCSVQMHILFSFGILLILEIIGLFLFDGFLNIAQERVSAAKIVYQCAITMIILSFISAPFKALLISYENLVYTSIIDVLDGVLKVGIAILLTHLNSDKLVLYGYLMIGVYLVNFLSFVIYDFKRYPTCVFPKLQYFNKDYLKSMGSFVVWQLYSTGCIIGRTQGIALVLNRFFGTVVNAAFGIALQVSGAISFISSALVTAINPQIIKAEGGGDRHKMFELAEIASKYSFLLLAMVVVPIIFVLPEVLKLWLGEVPTDSVLFCRVILIAALLDQVTYGLGTANAAIGNIKPYSLTVNTIKVLTVPALLILLLIGVEIKIAIWIYAIFELVCALTRLPFLKYNGGLNIHEYVKNVFGKIAIPFLFLLIAYISLNYLVSNIGSFILAALFVTILYVCGIYIFSLSQKEKIIIDNILLKVRRNKIG